MPFYFFFQAHVIMMHPLMPYSLYFQAPARQMLDEGVVPSFYVNKIQSQSYSSPAIMLSILKQYIHVHSHHEYINHFTSTSKSETKFVFQDSEMILCWLLQP